MSKAGREGCWGNPFQIRLKPVNTGVGGRELTRGFERQKIVPDVSK